MTHSSKLLLRQIFGSKKASLSLLSRLVLEQGCQIFWYNVPNREKYTK
jgi:hypothetical protein